MSRHPLQGSQYVKLAPGAAEAVAPYLRVPPDRIAELLLDLTRWPAQVRPAPLRGKDGRLLAGDPVLLSASREGLLFAATGGRSALVPWDDVAVLQVLPAGSR